MIQNLNIIAIHDDYALINEEYKKFKQDVYNQMCEGNQQSLDSIEEDLINEIKPLIQEDYEEDQEDNQIRAIIGIRVLSKYSIMNQKECINFFQKIDKHIPISIQKRLFFFKSITKVCNFHSNYLWSDYLLKFQQKILPIINDQPYARTSVINLLIYIDSLVQFSPNFLSKFSDILISHLIKIIHENRYTFDINYDILAKTDQTIDQYLISEDQFLSNNGIELLRKVLKRSKKLQYDSIKIDQILTENVDPKSKTLEILCALLEYCSHPFLNANCRSIQRFLISGENESQQDRILIARSLIYCMKQDEQLNAALTNLLFPSDSDDDIESLDPEIIIGKLQNLKILIQRKHYEKNKTEVVNFALRFIENSDNRVQDEAFDVINAFCHFCGSDDINLILQHKDQIFSKIHFKNNELVKLFYDDNQEAFTKRLKQSIENEPLEALQFLNNNKNFDDSDSEDNKIDDDDDDDNDDSNYIIDGLKGNDSDEFDNNIIQPILDQINSQNSSTRALVPLVLAKLNSKKFFTQGHQQIYFDTIQNDPSEQVKVAIFNSFNYLFACHDTNVDYQHFVASLNNALENIFSSFITNENVSESLLKSAILFLCSAAKLRIPSVEVKLKEFYSTTTSGITTESAIKRINARDSRYLPYIIKAIPTLYESEFEAFYENLFKFIQATTNEKGIRTQFQRKFYENVFCSYTQIFTIILQHNSALLESHINDIINICIECLNKGMRELETLNALLLLEQGLYHIGLEKTLELNEKKLFNSKTNLYNIVFKSGSHFVSGKINKVVFRILGFIGTQPLYEKREIINLKPSWRKSIKYEICNIKQIEKEKSISYSICSQLLYDILNDQSKSEIHFKALEILIDIQGKIGNIIESNNGPNKFEYRRMFLIFKKMLDNCSDDMKGKYVPLLKSLIHFNDNISEKFIPDMIEYLISFWNFGFSNAFKAFVTSQRSYIQPHLNRVMELVLGMNDPVELLVFIYKKFYFNFKKINFKYDIIKILIDMVLIGKYSALHGLTELIPHIRNMKHYIPLIIKACLQAISNLKQIRQIDDDDNRNDETIKKYINDSVEVLITLFINSERIDDGKEKFNENMPAILDALPTFLEDVEKFNEREILSEPFIMTCTDQLLFNNKDFIKLVSSIMGISSNDADCFIYIQQWIDELNMFCIKQSPNVFIRSTFPIVENNASFALSLFDIAFFSCINKLAIDMIEPVKNAFIHLLMIEKLPHQISSILLHLVEFLDRAGIPIISPKELSSLKRPISTILTSNPPLALRFTLLEYQQDIEKLNKDAAADLEQAFLNNGFFDQYQHFANENRTKSSDDNNNNNDNNNDDIGNSYLLPIHASTIEGIHQVQSANQFFSGYNWSNFNNEIEMVSRKVITHLFKAASLIEQYWENSSSEQASSATTCATNDSLYNYATNFDPKSDNNFESKIKILKEIDEGFKSLGDENRTSFSHSKGSIIQSIIYGQQFVEIQEMFLSNGAKNNFMQRFMNEKEIVSFIPPILLLRICSKGNMRNPLPEKVGLLSICRRTMKWDLMKKFYDHFIGATTNVPIEICYEMMYYKLANNEATETEIDSLLSRIAEKIKSGEQNNLLGDEYQYSTLEKFVKYQKALYYSHSSNEEQNYKDVLSLCNGFDYSEAINLWSWSNLKLFEIENKINYFDTEEEEEEEKAENDDANDENHFKYHKIFVRSKERFDAPRNTSTLMKSSKYRQMNYSYLFEAIRGYIKGSKINDKMIVPNMISIISLLFNHFTNANIINEVRKDLESIPLHFYLDSIPLIISYINQIWNDDFGDFIIQLLIDIMGKYPQGVIYDYSFSLFSDHRLISANRVSSSPIEKVKQYFNSHPEKLIELNCQNIFSEVNELTKNLYRISTNIASITYGFLTYVLTFLNTECFTNHERIEVVGFINDVEFIKNEYIVPLCKYLRKEKDGSEFEPTESEKAVLKTVLANEIKEIEEHHMDDKIIHKMDQIITDIVTCLTQITNDRIAFKFLPKKQYYEKQRVIYNKAREICENLHFHKKASNEIEKLTGSEKQQVTRILEPAFEDEDDDDDVEKIVEQNELYESSDSIEMQQNYSAPYTKSIKATLLLYDHNDKQVNNVTIYNTKEPIKKLHDKLEIDDNSAEDIRNKKSQKADLKGKISQRERRRFYIGQRIEANNQKLSLLNSEIAKLMKLFGVKAPKIEIKRSMKVENPQMERMVNLCLPVFGTFRYYEKPILISKFENQYTEMPSLIRPKRANVVGSDGKSYTFMLKSTEDLRVDQRNMILFRFMNRFLKTRIRTYSVTPLTVQFGVLQFVHNTKTIGKLINENRAKIGKVECEENLLKEKYSLEETKEYDSKPKRRKIEMFNCVIQATNDRDVDLRESMYYQAPDTETWSKYMVNFSDSCAVTSIVGYIIGIGDRHINNILVSQEDGYLIHIDFADCFEVDQHRSRSPEKVPFRLTRNIVAMLGPCGYNGCFRSACEDALYRIRENREVLFNILEVFYISPIHVHASFRAMRRPVIDVHKESRKNEFAMKRIKMKLDGTDRTIIYNKILNELGNMPPISVSEQVDKLISQATNPRNLALSYSGWRPWL